MEIVISGDRWDNQGVLAPPDGEFKKKVIRGGISDAIALAEIPLTALAVKFRPAEERWVQGGPQGWINAGCHVDIYPLKPEEDLDLDQIVEILERVLEKGVDVTVHPAVKVYVGKQRVG